MITDEFETNFNVLLSDANANYETSRYKDSAKGYEYLSHLCAKQGLVNDSLYFAYRTAISWGMSRNLFEIIKLYRSLGIFLLQQSAKLCESQLNSFEDTQDLISLLNNYQISLKYLKDEKKRLTCIDQLIQLYITEATHDYEKRIEMYEEAIKLAIEVGDTKLSKKLIQELALAYEKKSKEILNGNGMDKELVSEVYLDKARKLLDSIQ